MLKIIDNLLNLNRTIVSSDCDRCMAALAEEIPFTVHRYPSGSEYGTWEIPLEWNVIKAELTDGERVLAAYAEHPLFLAPYSCAFTGWVSREELMKHVQTSPDAQDAYPYEYRIALDYRRRLNEWRIALPHRLAMGLDQPQYFVDIQVETKPGHMLVGESTLKGDDGCTFAFLTHLCHPGQANDGLAGVAVGVEVMKRLKLEFPEPKHNYQLLVMPETVGSSVFLSDNDNLIESYLGSIFIEMAGIKSPIRLGLTRRGDTYVDRVFNQVMIERESDFTTCAFREHWGNDELVFDSAGVGIPGASIERYPFKEYHTSADDLAATDESRLQELVDILVHAVRVMESDFIPVPRQKVPIYLTRYDLYADFETERADHDINLGVTDLLWSGTSAFDIAHQLGVPFQRVHMLLTRYLELGLIGAGPITPDYFREGLNR
jgi:aminopeptidase-like protein